MIRVTIRKNRTGETRVYVDEYAQKWDDFAQFNWLQNNFSCDCNRHLSWLRAGGPPKDKHSSRFWNGAHRACGDWRYSIMQVEDRDGIHILPEQSEFY